MVLPNDIWTILKRNPQQYNFEPDVICVICETILKNAVCGPCGCRYCYECISQYLNGSVKCCPKNSEECRSEIIKLENNTHKDHAINRKISKIIIKCPAESCSFRDELKNIENHMRICSNLNNHDPHSKLLFKSINNLEKEFQEVRQLIPNLIAEIKVLKTANVFVKTDIEAHQNQIWELQKNQNNLCDKVKEISQMITPITGEININSEIHNGILSEIKEKHFSLEKEIEEMKKSLAERDNKTDGTIDSKNLYSISLKKIVNPTITNKIIYFQYFWEFDRLNVKRKASISKKQKEFFSNVFHTQQDGYQMCMKLEFDVYSSCANQTLYISLCVMKGKFDNELIWPLEYDISFELINPCTRTVHTSKTIYYVTSVTHPGRAKPSNGMNNGIGCFLVNLNEIIRNPEWEKEDKFGINCILSQDKF